MISRSVRRRTVSVKNSKTAFSVQIAGAACAGRLAGSRGESYNGVSFKFAEKTLPLP
jgi:hypothetical protein